MKRIISILLILCLTGCASTSTNRSVNADNMLTDDDIEEIKSGNEIHRNITSRFAVLDSPLINDYVREVGGAMLPFLERKNLPYNFTVLMDERIYATVAPGGYVYVTTGMLGFLKNEAELAGVVAHELARVQYRNPLYSQKRELAQTFSDGSLMIAPLLGPYGALAAFGFKIITQAAFRGRSKESQVATADRKALYYMINAEYDPQCYLDFLNRMSTVSPVEKAMFVSYLVSHPIDLDRLQSLDNAFFDLNLSQGFYRVEREKYASVMNYLHV